MNRPATASSTILLMVAVLTAGNTATGAQPPDAMPAAAAGVKLGEAPEWALLQRELLDIMPKAADVFLEKYVREDGKWKYNSFGSTLDDSFEVFFNWPMLYTLGGDERMLDIANRQFAALVEQITERNMYGGTTSEKAGSFSTTSASPTRRTSLTPNARYVLRSFTSTKNSATTTTN